MRHYGAARVQPISPKLSAARPAYCRDAWHCRLTRACGPGMRPTFLTSPAAASRRELPKNEKTCVAHVCAEHAQRTCPSQKHRFKPLPDFYALEPQTSIITVGGRRTVRKLVQTASRLRLVVSVCSSMFSFGSTSGRVRACLRVAGLQ